MSITDKITGRVKKAAGDLLGHDRLRTRGEREERKAEAKEELVREQERVKRMAREVDDLERLTQRTRSRQTSV